MTAKKDQAADNADAGIPLVSSIDELREESQHQVKQPAKKSAAKKTSAKKTTKEGR